MADTKAGTTRDMKIVRDGRQQTVKVNIAALKDDAVKPVLASAGTGPAQADGLSLTDLGLGLAIDEGDVVVASVKINSPAADAGIRVGDKVVKVNSATPTSLDAAKKAVDEAKAAKRGAVLFQFERAGTKYFVGVPFSELNPATSEIRKARALGPGFFVVRGIGPGRGGFRRLIRRIPEKPL